MGIKPMVRTTWRRRVATLSLIPWQPGYARVICDGHVHGKPYDYDSRVVLKRQIERLKNNGWILYTGLEPDSRCAHGREGLHHPSDETIPCKNPVTTTRASRATRLPGAADRALIAVGMDVYQIDHEDANGQFEINYTYATV